MLPAVAGRPSWALQGGSALPRQRRRAAALDRGCAAVYGERMERSEPAIGARACAPNAALQPFAMLVGSWRTEGSHGLLPGVTLHGRASFEWFENGAFLLMRTELDHASVPQGIALFGSDDQQRTCFMLYFDERGVSRVQHVSMEGNVLKWWRDQPGFSQRYTCTMSSDGKTMVGKGELSRDGATWDKDLDLTYSRDV
jgi:hypothetical protein